MGNFYFIGVDVSKKKLDFCLLGGEKVVHEETVPNHWKSVSELFKRLEEEYGIDYSRTIVCAEHTGQYTYPLSQGCTASVYKLWLEQAAQIKYSSGIQRGKDDRVDARRIAAYARRFHDRACWHKQPEKEIERLKQLEAERALYVSDLAKYKGQLADQKDYMPKDLYVRKAKRLAALMKDLEETIAAVNEEMDAVIRSNETLSRQMELLESVEGVGKVVALNMIVCTEAFTRFDDPRKFNCFAGLAPFSYTSGSSLHSRARVSHRADKTMKRLLHLAAVSVIRKKEGELKAYYERKVAEGKNKMATINAIRAKIVARMFAVIRKNQFYLPILTQNV